VRQFHAFKGRIGTARMAVASRPFQSTTGGYAEKLRLAVQLAGSQRGAASALSSGRVLKAITAPGAALCTALITASKIDRLGWQANACTDHHTVTGRMIIVESFGRGGG
jgi:hypothetical protein